MRNRMAAGVLLAVCAWTAGAQKVTAVRFAMLWDGAKVIDRALVVATAGRITSVQGGDPAPPAGAEVIDWSRYYGLPGLIDVHTHMTYVGDAGRGAGRPAAHGRGDGLPGAGERP